MLTFLVFDCGPWSIVWLLIALLLVVMKVIDRDGNRWG